MLVGIILALLTFLAGHAMAARVLGRSLRGERSVFRGRRAAVVASFVAGPVFSYLFAAALFAFAAWSGGEPVATLRVDAPPDGPAYAAGVRDGDRIHSIDGRVLSEWRDLTQVVEAASGTVEVEVERDGTRQAFTVLPESGKIGVSARVEYRPISLWKATVRTSAAPARAMVPAYQAIFAPSKVKVAGPVAVARLVSDDAGARRGRVLGLLALLVSTGWPFALLVVSVLFVVFRRRSAGQGPSTHTKRTGD